LSSGPLHLPVLWRETLEGLSLRPGATIVDVTVGLGGHAAGILAATGPEGRLIGLDRDPEALAKAREVLAGYGERARLVQGNFSRFDEALGLKPQSVDGLLADLGVSSLQLDSPLRGFSFARGGPLDMRMGPEGATAKDFLLRVGLEELETVFRDAGEERFARKLARRLKEDAEHFESTADLAAAVARCVPQRGKSHPATRVFLALRMAVNREMPNLREFLERAPVALKKGGRLAIIAFHSTEDRVVKWQGREAWREGPMRAVFKKPRIAGLEELRVNPRSRSAKLRVFEKI